MEHHFNIEIAKEYGIEEAILLHHFYYWIAKNAANDKHFHDGLYWTYNSKKAYADFFVYMNETKIFRVIKHLEDEKIITKGNFNTDKWDKTNWYAITKKGLVFLNDNGYDMKPFSISLQNDALDCVKMNDGACQNEQSIIINNTNKNNTNNNNKEENTNVSPKKNDYQAIVDCWNEYNGKRLGKVTKLTDRRKKAIKKALEDNGVEQEQLIKLFKALPHADKWLYNPNKQHQNWKPDFDWWLSNTNGWLTKAFEGKVHLENPQAFASIMLGDDAPYAPQTSYSLMWNDEYKCYIYVGMFLSMLADGYTDEDRPNGARIMLNNARGFVVWNSQTKMWEKQ